MKSLEEGVANQRISKAHCEAAYIQSAELEVCMKITAQSTQSHTSLRNTLHWVFTSINIHNHYPQPVSHQARTRLPMARRDSSQLIMSPTPLHLMYTRLLPPLPQPSLHHTRQ